MSKERPRIELSFNSIPPQQAARNARARARENRDVATKEPGPASPSKHAVDRGLKRKNSSANVKASNAEETLRILFSGEYSDVVITTGDSEENSKVFKAHKCILAAKSNFFANLFFGGSCACARHVQWRRVRIDSKWESEVVEKVLNYIYTGSYEPSDHIDTAHLREAAAYFGLESFAL